MIHPTKTSSPPSLGVRALRWIGSATPLAFGLLCGVSANPLRSMADEPAEKKITFDDHIKPIFREHCTACHAEGDKASDLALDTYTGVMAGGSSGDVIASGNPGGSRLYALVNHSERPFMPPDEDAIAKEKQDLLKLWIEQGMPENSGSKIKRASSAATAMLGTVSLGKPDGPPPMPESLLAQPVVETERSAAIAAMAASPWAPLIAVGGQEQVVLYHAQSGELLGVLPFPEGEPQSLTFTRDGKQLLIAGGKHSHSGCAVLVDIATGERITKVGDELDTVLAADISPDKKRIAIAGPQKIIRIFDSLSGEQVQELKKHTDWIFALRFSPDGVLLASSDRSNGLIVWEADSGLLYAELAGHKGEIRAIDFRADSNVLASASLDGTIKLWDMPESKEIKSWNAHGGGATAVAYAHDGSLASAGRDSKIKWWNAAGELQKEFSGLSETALEVALTGDAAQIAGGDWNGKVQIWQTADPEQVQLIAANPPSIESRLEAAKQSFLAIETEVTTLHQVAEKSQLATTEAQQALAALQATASNSQKSLAGAQSELTELTAQSTTRQAQVAELEAALAAAKEALLKVNEATKLKRSQVAELDALVKQQMTEVAAKEATQATLLAASQTAAQSLAQKQAQMELARAALEKAAAEKLALEQKAAELNTAAQTAAAAAGKLTEQLAAAVEEQDQRSAKMQEMAVRLEALNQQLASLQAQAKQAAEEQSAAQSALTDQQTMTSQLQAELEAAEQAAVEAQQQLDLFNQAYKAPQ
ncbi:c-type cytochrome domain-containing protein [Aureliella helgolandensis]|uniref:Chromosome partition protein Smc n=1 Tax=Aureliella helgolandensis TaxID=2527968 RepID=A0A518G2P9_9BACT|nr:c-type cytochrome domain-containing protein [Aureliella helgolandensis]QDV22840.1 Chromosome partition protein Smc [Aureliella helgolandensis]